MNHDITEAELREGLRAQATTDESTEEPGVFGELVELLLFLPRYKRMTLALKREYGSVEDAPVEEYRSRLDGMLSDEEAVAGLTAEFQGVNDPNVSYDISWL